MNVKRGFKNWPRFALAKGKNWNLAYSRRPLVSGNRRLYGQKVLWLWKKPFQILAERERCPDLLEILDEVRKYYESENDGETKE